MKITKKKVYTLTLKELLNKLKIKERPIFISFVNTNLSEDQIELNQEIMMVEVKCKCGS